MKQPGLDIFFTEVDEDGFHCGEDLNNLINWVCGELSRLNINSAEEAFPLYKSLSDKWGDFLGSNYIEEGEETNQSGLSWWRANRKKVFLLKAWFELTKSLPMLTTFSDGLIEPETADESNVAKPCWDHGVSHLIQAMHYMAMYNTDEDGISAVAQAGGKATAEKWAKAKTLAQEIADDTWGEWKDDPTSTDCRSLDNMAKAILETISADLDALWINSAPRITTIKKWIRDLAPDEALIKGRPKKDSPPAQ